MEQRFLTLLFTYPIRPKITSRIIAWRLKTEYSHVCGVVGTGPIGLFDVYEASHGNVHGVDLKEFLKKNKVIKTCRVVVDNKEEYYNIIRYLKKQRGKDYSVWGAIASTYNFLRKLGIGKDGDNEFMCSEYMARAVEQVSDIDYSKYRSSVDYVDPKIFEKILNDNGDRFFKGLHLPEYKGE